MDFRLSFVIILLAKCYYCCHGLANVSSSNILVFLPTEARSHFMGFQPLLEALVARGHNLTLVSPYPLGSVADDGSPLSPYKHIQVEIEGKIGNINFMDKNSLVNRMPLYLFVLCARSIFSKGALEKKTVKDFILNDNSSYDLIIFENFFHESFVTLGHKYKAPIVQLLPFPTNPRVSQWHSNPYNPSYIVDFANNYMAPMNFWQRAENTWTAIMYTWVSRLLYFPQQQAIMDEYFAYAGHEERPDLVTMLRNVSLTLVNSNSIIGSVAPFVPSFIQVAGMHIKSVKTLPQDLKTILDTAQHGVVYFSLGSVVKSSEIPPEMVSALLSKLSKIKQTVMWKWENDQLPNLPGNVIVRKWFPQNDILGHPNCRLFITHGGILSMIESIYYGVPMLSIPVFGDQKHNSMEAESRGYALYVPYFELTAEAFSEKLQIILNDSRFREAARMASSIIRDNPISIIEKAVYWIEYVIRHKGAPHLRTAANDLYWFQYYLLDVIAAFTIVLVFILYLNYKLFMYFLKKICPASSKLVSTKLSKSKQKRQ